MSRETRRRRRAATNSCEQVQAHRAGCAGSPHMAVPQLTLPPKWFPPRVINAQVPRSTFLQPDTIASEHGELNTTLDLGWVQHRGAVHALITRALGGSIPGPTIYVNPGDTLRVHFRNRLVAQPTADGPERPDVSNLHFHGLHDASELPGDDVTLPIGPRGEHTYVIEIQPDHMPGTFWIHPHVHRSTTLQVGSGAAATLIVRDPPGYLPAAVEAARELLWVVQYFSTTLQWNVAKMSGDETYAVFDENAVVHGEEVEAGWAMTDYLLVNGRSQPSLGVAAGEWMRWRLVYPGSQDSPAQALDLGLGSGGSAAGCEMQLLAKDGIYITDFPRAINLARVPAGGRADVMVRCTASGNVDVIAAGGVRVATLNVVSQSGDVSSINGSQSRSMAQWSPARPAYLADLSSAATACGCNTILGACHPRYGLSGERCVNGRPFEVTTYLHEAKLGAVQERTIFGLERHPYHQHIFPFQITGGFNESDDNPYFKPGDFHDTWQDSMGIAPGAPVTMRFRPLSYHGRMMLHCHWNQHSDDGMMASECIFTNASRVDDCACEAWSPAPAEHLTVGPPSNTICGRVDCYEGDDDTIEQLVLYGHGMSGTIPTEIGRFGLINYLGLGANSLSGTVPTELGLLTRLTHMHLWNNRLSGTVPSELSRLTLSYECNLARPSPAGHLPHYDGTCGGNQFACPIPTTLPATCHANTTPCTNYALPCAPPPLPPPPDAPPLPISPPRYGMYLSPSPTPPVGVRAGSDETLTAFVAAASVTSLLLVMAAALVMRKLWGSPLSPTHDKAQTSTAEETASYPADVIDGL